VLVEIGAESRQPNKVEQTSIDLSRTILHNAKPNHIRNSASLASGAPVNLACRIQLRYEGVKKHSFRSSNS